MDDRVLNYIARYSDVQVLEKAGRCYCYYDLLFLYLFPIFSLMLCFIFCLSRTMMWRDKELCLNQLAGSHFKRKLYCTFGILLELYNIIFGSLFHLCCFLANEQPLNSRLGSKQITILCNRTSDLNCCNLIWATWQSYVMSRALSPFLTWKIKLDITFAVQWYVYFLRI